MPNILNVLYAIINSSNLFTAEEAEATQQGTTGDNSTRNEIFLGKFREKNYEVEQQEHHQALSLGFM
ncbi:4508_t:CDS:2 [Diversispora eburnea]|uniref:4508_t:CDS:1 n=1 Tax=Diversispora eburnea TaxID=1213867 RepID=A0A9N8ZZM6_9GLOM|nr:4508_t:CDS:2 [Diversispora eburnea]